jgi:hypothetical protein
MDRFSPVIALQSLDDERTEGDNEELTRKEQGSAIDQESERLTARSARLALRIPSRVAMSRRRKRAGERDKYELSGGTSP